jgi:hypothetical protein
MATVHAVKTGTIRIRPSHRAGNNNLPVWRRRLAILLDRQWTPPLPIYTYLIEHDEGLILLDSGESARSSARGWFDTPDRIAAFARSEPTVLLPAHDPLAEHRLAERITLTD